MEHLERYLDQQIAELSESKCEDLRTKLESLVSIYPFNQYEFIIMTLMGLNKITLDDYYKLRDDYIERNSFMYLFELNAPRVFGEIWAHGHLKELVPSLQKPSKAIDPNYIGQYDFMLGGEIRIEVETRCFPEKVYVTCYGEHLAARCPAGKPVEKVVEEDDRERKPEKPVLQQKGNLRALLFLYHLERQYGQRVCQPFLLHPLLAEKNHEAYAQEGEDEDEEKDKGHGGYPGAVRDCFSVGKPFVKPRDGPGILHHEKGRRLVYDLLDPHVGRSGKISEA